MLRDMTSHVHRCSNCEFYEVMLRDKDKGHSMERDSGDARRRMERGHKQRDQIQNEMDEYAKSINDLKRKMRFVKKSVVLSRCVYNYILTK